MNKRQRATMAAIFALPVRANVNWADIESLLVALGAEVTEAAGSRVRVKLNGIRAVFHRPHPERETDKGALIAVREFLQRAGVGPDGEHD